MKNLKSIGSMLLFLLYYALPIAAQNPVELYLDRQNSRDVGNSVLQLDNGNLLLIGTTENAVSSTSGRDAFITCLNPNTGAIIWSEAYGSEGEDVLSRGSLQTFDNSSVVFVGRTAHTNGNSQMWFLRINPANGTQLVTSRFQASSLSFLSNVIESPVTDANGNSTSFLVVGLTNTHDRAYVARVNWNGTVNWENEVRTFLNDGQEWTYGIEEGANNEIFICGAQFNGNYHHPWLLRFDGNGNNTGSWSYDMGSDAFFDWLRLNPVTGNLQLVGRVNDSGTDRALFVEVDTSTLPANGTLNGVAPEIALLYETPFPSRASQLDYAGFNEILVPVTDQSAASTSRVLYLDFDGQVNDLIEWDQGTIFKKIFPLQNGSMAALGEERAGNQALYLSITNTDFITTCSNIDTVAVDTITTTGVWEDPVENHNPTVTVVDTLSLQEPINWHTNSLCCDDLSLQLNAPAAICAGTSATLTANVSGNFGTVEYLWSTGATTSSVSVAPTITSSYSVTITDQVTKCERIATYDLPIHPIPELSIDIEGPQPACVNTDIVLTVASTTGVQNVLWSNGAATASTNINTGSTGTSSYSVTVTDANGCEATTTTEVEVVNCCPGYADNSEYLQITADAADPRLIDFGITINGNVATLTVGQTTVLPNKAYVGRNMTLSIHGNGTVADFTNADMVFGDCARIFADNRAHIIANNAIFRPCDDTKSWEGIQISQPGSANPTLSFNECTFVNAQVALDESSMNNAGIALEMEVTNNLFLNCGMGVRISEQMFLGNITGNTFKINDQVENISYCESPSTFGGIVRVQTQKTNSSTIISQNHFLDATVTASQVNFEGMNLNRMDNASIVNNNFTNNDRAIVIIGGYGTTIENNSFEVTRRSDADEGTYQLTIESYIAGSNSTPVVLLRNNHFVNAADPINLTELNGQNGLFMGTGAIYFFGNRLAMNIEGNVIDGFEIGIFSDCEVNNNGQPIAQVPFSRIVDNKIRAHWFGIFSRGVKNPTGNPPYTYISCNEIDMDLDLNPTNEVIGIYLDPLRGISHRKYVDNLRPYVVIEGNCIRNTTTAVMLEHTFPADPNNQDAAYPFIPIFKHNYLYNYKDVGLQVVNMSGETFGNNSFISNNDALDIEHTLPFALPLLAAASPNRIFTSNGDHFGVDGTAQLNYAMPLKGDPMHAAASCGNQDIGTILEDVDLACDDELEVHNGYLANLLLVENGTVTLAADFELLLDKANFNSSSGGAIEALVMAIKVLSHDTDADLLYQSALSYTLTNNQQNWLAYAHAVQMQDYNLATQFLDAIQPEGELEADKLTLEKFYLRVEQDQVYAVDSIQKVALLKVVEHNNRYSERARSAIHVSEGGHSYRYKFVQPKERSRDRENLSSASANDNSFIIYPNPTSRQITIRLTNMELDWDQATLLDIHGRILMQQPINANQIMVDVQDVPQGVYFIRLQQVNGEIATQKFIKK